LQHKNEVFYVDSVTNIVRYMYTKMLQNFLIFYRPSVQWYLQNTVKKRSAGRFWAPYRE
jgi:hypothetical protein